MDLSTMEKSDILKTNKGGNIVYMTPYTDTDPKDETGVVRMDTDTVNFIHFPNFLCYHTHLPWRADTDINLSD